MGVSGYIVKAVVVTDHGFDWITDVARIVKAARRVAGAAQVEAQAFHVAADGSSQPLPQALIDAHLAELNAVNSLALTIELFESRHPSVATLLEFA